MLGKNILCTSDGAQQIVKKAVRMPGIIRKKMKRAAAWCCVSQGVSAFWVMHEMFLCVINTCFCVFKVVLKNCVLPKCGTQHHGAVGNDKCW